MPENFVTEFNMNVQDLMIIDTARRDAERILLELRYDGSRSVLFVDLLDTMYRVIKPSISTESNEARYKERREEVQALFTELYPEAGKQSKRASKINGLSASGASPKFLEKCRLLFEKLYILKDQVGLGIKRTQKAGLDGAFKRAAK